MIYRRRIAQEQIVNVPNRYLPVIRKRIGYNIYYRWTWWGLFDVKLKTHWFRGYKDYNIL